MDQNTFFNKDTRILAVDDAPFKKKDSTTKIVGIIMRRDLYIESLTVKNIQVDGMDVTDKVLEIINERGKGISVLLTKGLTFGGFNVLDVKRVFQETMISSINFMDHKPDMEGIRNALLNHFGDWEKRYNLLSGDFVEMNGMYVQSLGITTQTAIKFLNSITLNGKTPEPLRLADMIAAVVQA
ncbi:MAG: DUF99 family protein [Candidatus Thermoplasmatota archaeon]|jgi:endonuclease V-like protein UPF0215 family|nr:DUF99 family protein [Candidatus Thermoplasmatota archaeon]